MEIMRRTSWSISEQNSVSKEFLRLLAMWKPTGSVWKETNAVSATISISVAKLHHQIRLRILSCSKMSENHREPEVPEVEVRVVECLDVLARITSKEIAMAHCMKDGILQNACIARPRVVDGFGNSALSHIVGLMISQPNGPKRMMTKVQWLCWGRVIGKKEDLLPTNVTIIRGNLIRWVIRSWNKSHLNVDHPMHDNLLVYFKTWRCRSLFSGRAQKFRTQSNVWNSQRVLHVTPKFVTKILFSGIFAQVNFISVAPSLQYLRIGLRRRQSGKSKVSAQRRGNWSKMCWN